MLFKLIKVFKGLFYLISFQSHLAENKKFNASVCILIYFILFRVD